MPYRLVMGCLLEESMAPPKRALANPLVMAYEVWSQLASFRLHRRAHAHATKVPYVHHELVNWRIDDPNGSAESADTSRREHRETCAVTSANRDLARASALEHCVRSPVPWTAAALAGW